MSNKILYYQALFLIIIILLLIFKRNISSFESDQYKIFMTQEWSFNSDNIDTFDKMFLEGVIVEPRDHWNLLNIIKNYNTLYPYSGITVFHSDLNKKTVLSLPDTVKLINLNLPSNNLTISEYNTLLTSVEFWKQLRGEYIFIFQTDSSFHRNDLFDYIDYDYIGSETIFNGTYCLNGGTCIRKKQSMIDICTKYPYKNEYENEDVYFSKHSNLPDKSLVHKFGLEGNFPGTITTPSITHKAYAYHSEEENEKIYAKLNPFGKVELIECSPGNLKYGLSPYGFDSSVFKGTIKYKLNDEIKILSK